MRFYTLLKTGIEVLHLGAQNAESAAWPIEHWRENKGRWRLYMPAIDDYLNNHLATRSYGASVERFVLLLEIADFAAWGGPPAFTGEDGYVSYRWKNRELCSVGKLNWLEIQFLTPAQQLEALRGAVVAAIERVSKQKRKSKDFRSREFADELSALLKRAKVSEFGRTAYLQR
jgi:hypothetical protein